MDMNYFRNGTRKQTNRGCEADVARPHRHRDGAGHQGGRESNISAARGSAPNGGAHAALGDAMAGADNATGIASTERAHNRKARRIRNANPPARSREIRRLYELP